MYNGILSVEGTFTCVYALLNGWELGSVPSSVKYLMIWRARKITSCCYFVTYMLNSYFNRQCPKSVLLYRVSQIFIFFTGNFFWVTFSQCSKHCLLSWPPLVTWGILLLFVYVPCHGEWDAGEMTAWAGLFLSFFMLTTTLRRRNVSIWGRMTWWGTYQRLPRSH